VRPRADLDVFGPSVPRLPWRSSGAARSALDDRRKREVATFEHALGQAWASDDPVRAFGDALRVIAGGDVAVLYPGAVEGPPRWTLSTLFTGYRGELPIRDRMPALRAYGARATDRFANRPVGFHDLARHLGSHRVERIMEEILAPVGFFHQLRTVLYDRRGEVALFAGLYRGRRARRFDVTDHQRLFALQPALRRWATLAGAFGFEPLGDGALVRSVGQLAVPAVVVHRKGIVYANGLARALAQGARTRLDDLRRRGSVIPLRTAGARLDLILLPGPVVDETSTWLAGLPPYLRPIAALLREGLTDKEIAARLEAPLSTVRTYVQRTLTVLGGGGRRTLMRAR
jgi:hypothetical protein